MEFRKLRKRSGLTQASVATAAGISIPAIRKLERGLGNLATWAKALDALGWTLRGRNRPAGDSIGLQVAILRKRLKLSQRSFAAMAGITQPTVIALEVRNSGRLSSLNAILTVLGAGPVLSPAGEKFSFYTHAGNSSAHEAWSTPTWMLDRLYSVFDHFDLDPCSATKDRRLTRVKARASLSPRLAKESAKPSLSSQPNRSGQAERLELDRSCWLPLLPQEGRCSLE